MSICQVVVCECVSCITLTRAGGSLSGRSDTLASSPQQDFLIFSQSLFGQVALPLDLQLQRLRNIRYDPVNGSQH